MKSPFLVWARFARNMWELVGTNGTDLRSALNSVFTAVSVFAIIKNSYYFRQSRNISHRFIEDTLEKEGHAGTLQLFVVMEEPTKVGTPSFLRSRRVTEFYRKGGKVERKDRKELK